MNWSLPELAPAAFFAGTVRCGRRAAAAVPRMRAARARVGDAGRRESGARGRRRGAVRDHRVDDAIALEHHREAAVVPAGDRGLLLRASADCGVTVGGRAELLLDLTHGEATLRTLDLRVAHLHLVVDDDGFGGSGARQRTATEQCGEDA